jgi:hypothetical protein
MDAQINENSIDLINGAASSEKKSSLSSCIDFIQEKLSKLAVELHHLKLNEDVITEPNRRTIEEARLKAQEMIDQWHRESANWHPNIKLQFEEAFQKLKAHEESLILKVDEDYKAFSSRIQNLSGVMKDLAAEYCNSLDEYLAPIKKVIFLIENSSGVGGKYIARSSTEIPKTFSDIHDRAYSFCGTSRRIELFFDEEDISYQIGSTMELMEVFGSVLEKKLSVVNIRVQFSKKRRRSASPNATEAQSMSGNWEIWEEKLFEKGVKRYGWGRWSRIANLVGRSRQQVQRFSTTQRGYAYKEQSTEDRLLLDLVADTAQATKMYMEKKLKEDDDCSDEEDNHSE